jgi:broad specificity phosphatase PhoE
MTTPQTKNIYFARHGERIDWIDKTWMDTAERCLDPPLSPYGLEQAHELGIYVAQIQPRITHVYASPFLRTIQTALQVVNQLNKNISSSTELTKIRLEPGFGEHFLSDVTPNENNIYQPLDQQLSSISQSMEYFDHDYESVIKSNYYSQTGEENRQQLRDRLRRVVQCTLDAHTTNCNILIVTHAATLIEGVRTLATVSRERSQKVIKKEEVEITTNQEINNLSEWDMSPVRAGVCSLTHLELKDDKWTLSKNGFTSYLSKGEQNVWFFPDDKSLYEKST